MQKEYTIDELYKPNEQYIFKGDKLKIISIDEFKKANVSFLHQEEVAGKILEVDRVDLELDEDVPQYFCNILDEHGKIKFKVPIVDSDIEKVIRFN